MATALRCERLIDPRGIEEPHPYLSWQFIQAETRGQRQTACQVQVGASLVRLAAGEADLWNYVSTTTDGSIDYAGKTLASRQCCFWRVRIKDENNRWSNWSEPASWSMGMITPAEWTAHWIGASASELAHAEAGPSPNQPHSPDPWLRRKFTLVEKPLRATAFVASVGYHELYVNGHRIGEAVLAPNVSDLSQRARYVAYEICDYLVAGENVIGLWLGTGWSAWAYFATPDKPTAPIVLGQFDFDFSDGRTQRLVTDSAWKIHSSPNALSAEWRFGRFGGELYDARLENDQWANPDFDDSGWSLAAEFAPRLILSADIIEPNYLGVELHPIAINEPEPGVFRIDFGRNFTGWVEVPVEGKPGDKIQFGFSEDESKPVTHRMESVYIIGLSGHGVFRNRFNYSAGRWLTIRGLHSVPDKTQVIGHFIRNGYGSASSFNCSNELLNAIYTTTLWTFENLTLGGFVVDCPHRERMGYGGDAHATTTTGLLNYSLAAFYAKWAEDWRDVQRGGHLRKPQEFGDGDVPHTAPTYWGGGGPAWGGYCVHLTWELYRIGGDRKTLAANWKMCASWLAFLEAKSRGNLLHPWDENQTGFLGDWLWPNSRNINNSTTRDTLFFNNCYWVYNLQTAACIAHVLGLEAKAAEMNTRAQEVRESIHREFFNAADSSYVSGSEAYLAAALLAEVPPPELRPAVWKRLEHEILDVRTGHIDAGITGGALLFKLLMEGHRDDLIYPMVNRRDFPSWGNLLGRGATTWWEWWGEEGNLRPKVTLSRLHSSYLYVGAWFIHDILGIQPDPGAPGFQRFVIHPGPINQEELTWASGHYDSVHGRIFVSWKRNAGEFILDVTIPPNTEARIDFPASIPSMIREGESPVGIVSDVRVEDTVDGRTQLRVGSGHYRFRSPI